jgi:hypothetical protein
MPSFMTISSGILVIFSFYYLNNLKNCSVGIIDGMSYNVYLRNGFRWHDIHIQFHEDQFRHSSNINVITSTIREAAVLVLLMGGIYKVFH